MVDSHEGEILSCERYTLVSIGSGLRNRHAKWLRFKGSRIICAPGTLKDELTEKKIDERQKEMRSGTRRSGSCYVEKRLVKHRLVN